MVLKQIGNIKYKKDIEIFFYDNYLKILKEIKKEIESEELAAIYLENEAKTSETEMEKKETDYDAIAKTILIILFFPIFIIGTLIYGVCKYTKQQKF